jgi:alkylated DNA repair dioxygenase AlkB
MTFRMPAEAFIEVQVPLPARSLYIMSGNARTMWQHGIQKGHVKDRRLVMTVREVTGDIADYSKEPIEKELRKIA